MALIGIHYQVILKIVGLFILILITLNWLTWSEKSTADSYRIDQPRNIAELQEFAVHVPDHKHTDGILQDIQGDVIGLFSEEVAQIKTEIRNNPPLKFVNGEGNDDYAKTLLHDLIGLDIQNSQIRDIDNELKDIIDKRQVAINRLPGNNAALEPESVIRRKSRASDDVDQLLVIPPPNRTYMKQQPSQSDNKTHKVLFQKTMVTELNNTKYEDIYGQLHE